MDKVDGDRIGRLATSQRRDFSEMVRVLLLAALDQVEQERRDTGATSLLPRKERKGWDRECQETFGK